jgi:hypothetical protein
MKWSIHLTWHNRERKKEADSLVSAGKIRSATKYCKQRVYIVIEEKFITNGTSILLKLSYFVF